MPVTAMIAEYPIAGFQRIHHRQRAKLLPDARMHGAGEFSLGKQPQQPLLKLPDDCGAFVKCGIHQDIMVLV